MRRSTRSPFTSPVLIGAATVLVLLIAVFLAYNANQGLPFVPTRTLNVDIGSGANLVVGNDVREGGYRVGQVAAMKPVQLSSGAVVAQLTLQLDQAHGDVPVDSTVSIGSLSALGLKYVDLHTGSSKATIPDGGTLPISQTNVPVQLDQVFSTFDPKTRGALQRTLAGSGDALTGRGSALNDTIASLPSLLGHAEPVAKNLSAPSTQLTRFIRALNQFTGAIAPVARTSANLFTDMATTFAAIGRDQNALEQTIAESPSTLSVGTQSLRVQQPLLTDLATLGSYLSPATSELVGALPQVNPAIEQGTRVLAQTPELDQELQDVMTALKNLAVAPGTNMAVNGLTDTVQTLNPVVRYLGPYQTVCDGWNYFWTYFADSLSAPTNYGFANRVMINTGVISGNGVGAQGANAPANGEKGGGVFGGVEYLHVQPYGAAVDNKGNADCESGQRGYMLKLNHGDPQGRNLVTDQHTPGDQGPNFAGPAKVPAGETFSRNPQTGPQTPYVSANP